MNELSLQAGKLPLARYKLLVTSRPVAGREQEYNDWYQNVHLRDVVAIEGYRSAQRFRFNQLVGPGARTPYLAIDDIETDDIDAAVEELMSRAASGKLPVSSALSSEGTLAVVYEEFGPAVRG